MRLLLPALLLIGVLLAVASFDAGHPRAEVVVAQAVDNFTLDPQRMSWQHDLRVARSIYETLVTKDPDGVRFNPGVAERWETSPDGRTWTFHLRPDARWSNGDPVRAGDFIYAWRRMLLPDLASDYSGFLFEIEGAKDFYDWRQAELAAYAARAATEGGSVAAAEDLWQRTVERFDRTVALHAPDDRTLTVTLQRPLPYWLEFVSFATLSPVHPATQARFSTLDPASGMRRDSAGWTKPGTSVTNGPMLLADWRYKRQMRLEPNPHHWDHAAHRPASIDILTLSDDNTAVLAFEAGAVDWLTEVRAGYKDELVAQADRYLDDHRAAFDALRAGGRTFDQALAALPAPGPGERRDVHPLDAFGTDFFNFNCRPALPGGELNPFKDAAVRRAFAMALDKEALCDRVVRIGEPPAQVLVPPRSIAGYRGPAGLPHDAERARAELKAAGWEDRDGDGIVQDAEGRPFPTVELMYSTGSPRYRDLSLAMADMWRRNLGVPVEVRGKDAKFFKEDLKKGNFMVARGGWYGDYADPTTFLDFCRTGDGNNDRGYSSPRFDALLDRAAAERDPAVRMRTLAEAERVLVEEDLPLVPISHFRTIYMYDPLRLAGIARNPRLEQRYADLHRVDVPAAGGACPPCAMPPAVSPAP
jgi:oligopeptide transport system substrate-binding protein